MNMVEFLLGTSYGISGILLMYDTLVIHVRTNNTDLASFTWAVVLHRKRHS